MNYMYRLHSYNLYFSSSEAVFYPYIISKDKNQCQIHPKPKYDLTILSCCKSACYVTTSEKMSLNYNSILGQK